MQSIQDGDYSCPKCGRIYNSIEDAELYSGEAVDCICNEDESN